MERREPTMKARSPIGEQRNLPYWLHVIHSCNQVLTLLGSRLEKTIHRGMRRQFEIGNCLMPLSLIINHNPK